METFQRCFPQNPGKFCTLINNFYTGHRCTDDGVKAAATNSMTVLTGIEGQYDSFNNTYDPPSEYRNWAEVVHKNNLRAGAENLNKAISENLLPFKVREDIRMDQKNEKKSKKKSLTSI